MNRVEELIQQLCPNRVEWKKLGDYIELYTGEQLNKDAMLSDGVYPVMNGGVLASGFTDSFNEEADTITISQGGASAGFVNWIESKFWAGAHCFIVKVINDKIINRYLYFFLKNSERKMMLSKYGAGIPSLSKESVNKLLIPIPPLPIQQEIVRILDTFTELTANLQTELDARKKQYAYYRDCLLNFEGVDGVEWKKMGEIGTFIRGKRFVRADIVEGGIPCIHYGDVYTFYGLSAIQTKGMLRSDLAAKMRYAHKNDVVIVAAGENKDDIGIGVAWLGKEDAAVHDACFIFRSDMDPNFVSHYLRTNNYHLQIKKHVSEGKICSISADGLGNIMIPIPPLSEQRRIVAILDQFETLVNDQTVGLPAELKARRKQYEYYRDKLLTFDRV